MIKNLIEYAICYPKRVTIAMIALSVLAVLQFPRIKVDTDPENMLPANTPVRVFHEQTKKEFALYDMIVLGIINDHHPDGVFNVPTLTKIYHITEEIKEIDGVVAQEIISPSTKDNIEQAGPGTVRFNWLMAEPPSKRKEALKIRDEAEDNPMFYGSLVSQSGKALCLYIPIEKKDLSYEVAQKIKAIYAKYPGEENFYITGLPIANDQFGVEMFKQMAISAPLAGFVIFLLMWFFFKSVGLIMAPMILAIVTVVTTMGLLIGLGFPVHIMSSMIPIFLMPISVLDSVHILSEFFDVYPHYMDRRKAILKVFGDLFRPMLFTSLTSIAGFFSLSFSPIPPVQVFGVFVALGVAIAWILTMLFIPAYLMLLGPRSFRKLERAGAGDKSPVLDKVLKNFRQISVEKFKYVLGITVLVIGASIYGITKIEVNDNPVRWFTAGHPIRVADKILNRHFAGTYQAYLVLEAQDPAEEIFVQPQMLRYIENLQQALVNSGYVGKTMSLADIVKKVYYELLGGDKAYNVIPPSKEAVAQCLISFENSHKPDDLWHMTTPDYSKLNLWLQLKSGDNKDMERVVRFVQKHFQENSPPFPLKSGWAGLTYINVVWQKNMVGGMLKNFLGSFIIVLFMMLFLFRSPVKALISMIPLSVTILFIYSLLGFTGKDYDMPVAVLSALTLGLSIDFAIHFIERAVAINRQKPGWEATAEEMFTGPGRAISRNALVVAVGFLPLLAAPLVPYKTVGFFMFAIMTVSSAATLFILPAIISIRPSMVLEEPKKGMGCRCSHCILIALFVALAVAYVLFGYTTVHWTVSTWMTIGTIVIFAVLCYFASKRRVC